MENVPIAENETQRERLARLVGELDRGASGAPAEQLRAVTVILAQMAFWDRWALCLIHRWRTGELPPPSMPPWYDKAINQTLTPQWQALSLASAADLAVNAARAVDRELARAETPVIVAIGAAGESHLLHRHRTRKAGLDEIEKVLAGQRP